MTYMNMNNVRMMDGYEYTSSCSNIAGPTQGQMQTLDTLLHQARRHISTMLQIGPAGNQCLASCAESQYPVAHTTSVSA